MSHGTGRKRMHWRRESAVANGGLIGGRSRLSTNERYLQRVRQAAERAWQEQQQRKANERRDEPNANT